MSATQFSQLQIFLTVARLRSFSAAARELGVTRSAASQAGRQLEDQLRVVLLASVSPTDAGKRLGEAAEPGFREVLGALASTSTQLGEGVGRLRLTVPNMAVPSSSTGARPSESARALFKRSSQKTRASASL
jgi:DNA-binding transcriptional LysR family regulator